MIAKSVDIPIIMYNVPSRTGCNILPETAAKIVNSVDNIVAIKEATGNISQVARLMALTEGKIDLYSGNDDQIVPLLSLGGKGVISVLSNVAPRQTHDICQAYFDGDVERAAKLQLEAIPMCDALFCEVNPIPVKTAMNLMGKEVGPLRRPLSPMEKANEEKLIKAMKNYGLLA
jgi:4-hydroxy-tetrahydrodipicolinate synthase